MSNAPFELITETFMMGKALLLLSESQKFLNVSFHGGFLSIALSP